MERIGFSTGYYPDIGLREMTQWMKAADERGYEAAFFVETIETMRDSVSALALFAASTTRVRLGCTQIVRLRSPVIMAQTLATLDELSEGRMFLAPGACTPSHAARYGLAPADPVISLKESVTAMREILTGEEVTCSGETVKLDRAGLAFKPYRTEIPMWIAATSRTGLHIAGEIGDGVLLNSNTSHEYSRNAVRIVGESCEKAGRDFENFEIAQIIVTSIDDDRDKAIEAVRFEVANKFDRIQLPFNAGPRMRVGEPYIKKEDLPKFAEAEEKGGKEGLMKAMPVSYIQGLTASGTPQEVLDKVEKYKEAGVKLPIIRPAHPHQVQRTLDLFAPK
ncbi:MAG: LLM class flavin-dependent oxidoreductase [Nitrospinota bacterium]|jgi:alkanesulfonate monooxygenase SsuD/methylene tetrahydromethanopterin reductase-like flavin-dependent oxidoreductase (luciferase family)|nr:LLM class flavin-dependent oxidoreductase [Nitrospinota bacterium]